MILVYVSESLALEVSPLVLITQVYRGRDWNTQLSVRHGTTHHWVTVFGDLRPTLQIWILAIMAIEQ